MLLWLDFETTGLSPIHNRVIEAGWTLTTDDLKPLLWDSRGEEVVQHELVTLNMDTWAQLEEFNAHFDMHIKSGLYDDLKESQTTLMLSDIEESILADIEASGKYNEHVILAGSGVHFDRDFIKLWMPRLAERLHYRLFDTSTIKRFLETVGIGQTVANDNPHRAANDVEETLTQVRQWQADLITAADQAYHVARTGKAL